MTEYHGLKQDKIAEIEVRSHPHRSIYMHSSYCLQQNFVVSFNCRAADGNSSKRSAKKHFAWLRSTILPKSADFWKKLKWPFAQVGRPSWPQICGAPNGSSTFCASAIWPDAPRIATIQVPRRPFAVHHQLRTTSKNCQKCDCAKSLNLIHCRWTL